ncbi:MAG: hypothetical protein AAFY34_14160 [Pseudomonadota bacterium]
MVSELEDRLFIKIQPEDQDAYEQAVQRGSIAELKSALLASASSAEQIELIDQLLPPDLVISEDGDV